MRHDGCRRKKQPNRACELTARLGRDLKKKKKSFKKPCCSEKMGLFGGALVTCFACSLSAAQCLSVSSVTAGRDGNLISA